MSPERWPVRQSAQRIFHNVVHAGYPIPLVPYSQFTVRRAGAGFLTSMMRMPGSGRGCQRGVRVARARARAQKILPAEVQDLCPNCLLCSV